MVEKPTQQQISDFLGLFDNDAVEAVNALRTYHPVAGSVTRVPQNVSDKIIVSIDSLTKTYRINKQNIDVLKGITVDIYESEFIAITGASGSGKSTLLQLVGGLDNPTSGKISIDGMDINQLSDAKRATFRNRTIGFVFQFFYLQPFLSIAKNVAVPGMFAHSARHTRQQHVDELLEKVGLEGQARYLPKQLSGGQIQRAAIARALLNSPRILLADEPTGNLDSTNSKAIIELFRRIRDELGTTVVIVTHDQEIASQADRQIRLQDGVLV